MLGAKEKIERPDPITTAKTYFGCFDKLDSDGLVEPVRVKILTRPSDLLTSRPSILLPIFEPSDPASDTSRTSNTAF